MVSCGRLMPAQTSSPPRRARRQEISMRIHAVHRLPNPVPGLALAIVAALLGGARAQPPATAAATAADHADMMAQLGITALRPGPSGNESAANHANYDEAVANPFPKLPDPLT